MTSGNILAQLLLFSLPLLLGNAFQLLYNTVDSYVVGNYVGTEALAAVGATAMIINIVVFFFNGLSIGAGVLISRKFGERNIRQLHQAVETTMAMTFALCVFFTIFGVLIVRPMLLFMSTPEDVIPEAMTYLRIYMAGIAGLMIYNMGSGVLRAVGDTTRPLYFLILTSILNVGLDFFFVLRLRLGVAGVAYATIISQAVSAVLILTVLTRTNEIYRLTWKDLSIDKGMLGQILAVGLPTSIQSMLTSFSNVFVQSYVNAFGSSVVAGWSCYSKLSQFVMLPMDSIAKGVTTFVSQNVGAGNEKRVARGTVISILTTEVITAGIISVMILFAEGVTGIFSKDAAVITVGAMFVRVNMTFIPANCVNHTLAGALRGHGDSRGPMIIMMCCFIGMRQLFLYVGTHFISNTPDLVAYAYPVGWVSCCVIELIYYFHMRRKMEKGVLVLA